MKTLLLTCLLLTWSVPAWAQSLDIDRHRFTDDFRVLTTHDYLPAATLRMLEEAGADLPAPVAVGSKNAMTVLYREVGVALIATEEGMDWQQMSRTNSWAVECHKDAMDDSGRCVLVREDLRVVLHDDDRLVLLVGQNHYPGTGVAVRVDEDEPFQSEHVGFEGSRAMDIVERLLSGQRVRTRFQEWPYRGYVDRTLDLTGFNEAYAFLHWIVGRIQ